MGNFSEMIRMPAVIAAGSYLLFLLILFLFQPNLVYFPSKNIESTPASIGLEYESVTFISADKKTLFGWFIPAKNPKATLLFLHGNAGNISHRLDSIEVFNLLGLNVFIFDYRGYGKSEGRADEKNTYEDAKGALAYLLKERGIKKDEIIIFGRSLGASVAAYAASGSDFKGVILESPFISAKELAKDIYPFFVPSFLVRYGYETKKYVKEIASPLLIIHSRDDEIVPFWHGVALFEAANEPKKFLELRGSHNYGFIKSAESYKRGLEQFINGIIIDNQ